MSLDPIERIKAEIDLRDLTKLELGRSHGAQQQGRCPFCLKGVKTPCFTYYSANNSYFCFSCGRGGTVIDFYMVLHGCEGDPARAIRELAERAGIELPAYTPEQQAKLAEDRRIEEAMAYAANFYARQLAGAGPLLAYLHSRGFTPETIKEQRLGYANRQLLAAIRGDQAGLEALGLALADFKAAGLIGEDPDSGRLYDFMNDRIVFPITRHGRVVHMSGRAIPEELGGRPTPKKYKNLPRPIAYLYLQDEIGDGVTVFEGLPDTLAAHQAGIRATGQQGTNGMDRHAPKFARCKNVFLCFDTDGPGRAAALKAGAAIFAAVAPNGGQVRLVRLPEGVKDTNDFFMQGGTAEGFKALQAEAKPLLDELLAGLSKDMEHGAKAEAAREVLRLAVPLDPIQQDTIVKGIKARLGLGIGAVRDMLKTMTTEATQAVQEANAKADASGVVVDFTAAREIVPVQDYTMDPLPVGNFATYLQVVRTITNDDGKPSKIRRWEPVLLTATHDPANGFTPRLDYINDLPLSHAEARRVPSESAVRGRWRTEAQHPYGVAAFVAGKVTHVDAWQLYSDILGTLRRYIWLPRESDHQIVAAWIMQTYVFRLFNTTGYLHLHGVRESGKTNLMSLIEEMSFNARQVASQTQSTLFRGIEANARTVLTDEAERLNNPEPNSTHHDLMTIANAGYKKKGGVVEISEPDPVKKGAWTPTGYDVFGPKVYASIAELYYVLRSRCIVIPCLRATAEERQAAGVRDLAQNQHKEEPVFAGIRDRLYCWALLNFPRLHALYTDELVEAPSLAHLRGRERELWMPLLTVAAHLDEARVNGNFAELPKEASLAINLAAAQRHKEQERRLEEGDQAIEVVALVALYEIITGGDIVPVRPDSIPGLGEPAGAMYVLKDLADLVTQALVDLGLFREARDGRAGQAMGSQRLVNLLAKTRVIEGGDRLHRKVHGEKKRCVVLDTLKIKGVIERLGGSVSEPDAKI